MNAPTRLVARGMIRLCVVMLLCSSLCAQRPAQPADAQEQNQPDSQFETVTVSDPRPVAAAVKQLEAIYEWPITYEDPMTVNDHRLEDVTEQVQRTPNPSRRVIIQKSGTLLFTYQVTPPGASEDQDPGQARRGREAAVSDALTSVLDGYAASGGPETFTVREEDGIFHVAAINFLNKEGALQESARILGTKITILPKQRTRSALFQEICRSLSKTAGILIAEGTFPRQGSEADTPTPISGSDVTAQSLLSQLLAELSTPVYRDLTFKGSDNENVTRHQLTWNGGPISWELLYGPEWGYALNVYAISQDSK